MLLKPAQNQIIACNELNYQRHNITEIDIENVIGCLSHGFWRNISFHLIGLCYLSLSITIFISLQYFTKLVMGISKLVSWIRETLRNTNPWFAVLHFFAFSRICSYVGRWPRGHWPTHFLPLHKKQLIQGFWYVQGIY